MLRTNTKNAKVKSGITRIRHSVVLVGMIVLAPLAGPAQAQYSYHFFEYPGADSTQAFGINNSDKVVGSATMPGSDDGIAFQFDIRKDKFTQLPDMEVAFGVTNSGRMAGAFEDECAIRDKKGNVTIITPPSDPFDPADLCNARGINSSGKVAGFEARASGWSGFVYDSEEDTFEVFLHSLGTTIAHGINAQGQIVGNTFLTNEGDAYPGSPVGTYGFLREADGTVNFFRVNGEGARARGISENGQMTGWYLVPVGDFLGNFVSWVADLPTEPGYEDIALTEDQILDPGPCNPDLVPPSADWTLFTDVTAEAIRNDGVIAGNCLDFYVLLNPLHDPNGTIDDVIGGYQVGFVAVPE